MNEAAPPVHDEMLEAMLGDFLDESGQLLGRLNENLLQLDQWVRSLGDDHGQRCDEDLLNEMFRAAHSLKGLSAMLGLKDINALTHRVENVFDAARKDELVVHSGVVELMFQALDRLVNMVEALREPNAAPVECEAITEDIRRLLQSAGAERRQSTQADAERALQATPAAPAAPAPPADDHFAGLADDLAAAGKYLPIFIDETDLSLDELTELLLGAERGGSPLSQLMATAHRIKGSAASVGLARPAKLSHLMEDLLQGMMETHQALPPALSEPMLECVDGLRQYVAGLRRGESLTDDFNRLARQLLAAAQLSATSAEGGGVAVAPSTACAAASPAAVASQAETKLAVPEAWRRQMATTAKDPSRTWVGQVTFEPDLPLVGLKARLVYEKLLRVGEVCGFDPPADGLDDLESLAAVRFAVRAERPAEEWQSQLRLGGVCAVAVERLGMAATADGPASARPATPADGAVAASATIESAPAAPSAAKAEPAARPCESAAKANETLRVDIERLDQLMNLAGELVINKACFVQIAERLKSALGGQQAAGSDVAGALTALFETIHQLDRVADGIQQSVMDTRMVPIGPLFARFKRVVRDISRASNKQIQLTINGEKTELDKRMIDELGDPLIHLVRNAADHGIESPEARAAAGKPPAGTITLDAFHRGNNIIIEVSDDGKGLDAERIRRKAIDKALISEADAERLTRQQVFQLIWAPGLSTAEKVTDISGRGMGMDIVRAKIEELNGAVELDSEPGRGTRVSIKLPLTLAILPSLMVEIEGEVFAMPLEAVAEIVRVSGADRATVQGRRVACIRGRVIPAVRLDEVFSWAHRRGAAAEQAAEQTLVLIGERGRELGLAVDRVLGEEDVVIKSMAENYRNVAGVAGASILGDGRVSLILDLAALTEMAARRTAAPVPPPHAAAPRAAVVR